jgi:hypothetical protein
MKRMLFSLFLALAIATAQIGAVAAQTTTIDGTITNIAIVTDATTGASTVEVTVVDSAGTTQTLSLSMENAATLGLVTTDPATGATTVDTSKLDTTISIDPAMVIPPEPKHPVGEALADYFGDLVSGVDYAAIMDAHDSGVGFGVIAQALWMAKSLGGDSSTFQAILDAKQSGDYSAFTLPDGSTPTNWGQFRKALSGGKGSAKQNLGSVKSGKAADATIGETKAKNANASGKDNNGKGNNDNKGNGSDKGKGNGKGNGNGKP